MFVYSLNVAAQGLRKWQLLAASDRIPLRVLDKRIDDEVQLLFGDLVEVEADDGLE